MPDKRTHCGPVPEDERLSRARFCGGCGRPLSPLPTASARPAPGPTASLPPGVPGATGVEGGTDTAERRQLTVVFADLMESTALSEQLDPEVLRRVLRAYQEACAAKTRRLGGHLAQYLGDGVVIFFGYPVVHEDSARRAVQTALGILARVEALNRAFQPELGLELGVRLGLHTGIVVVEDVKDEGLRIRMATGETPNIAARVQAQAPRNGAVLTKGTRRLVAPFF